MKTLAPLTLLCVSLSTAAALTQRPQLRFARPTETTIADRALTGAASGDFNGDGRMDLAVGSPDGQVHVSLAGRRGALGAPVSYTAAAGSGHVAVADFDNDGALDIVFAGGGIAVLRGNGDGTFQAPVVSLGSAADVVVADFDGDGLMDIASVGKNGISTIPDTVDVYPGQGDGTFGAPRTLATSDDDPAALAAADLNGDGRVDLVFGVRDIRQLVVYLNSGDLTFTPHDSAFLEAVGPSRTTAADLDGDGDIDVLTANFTGSVSLFAGRGDGTLAAARTFAVCSAGSCPAPQWAALADMDGDGALDVVTANQRPGSASVLLNDGAGGLGTVVELDDVRSFAYAAVPGDFDGNGVLDLAVTNGAAAFLEPGERVVSTFMNRQRPGAAGNGRRR
jgi:hypothetical protein